MVFEYADSTLFGYLQRYFHKLTWMDKYKLALGITDGLLYLHKLKIVHKNLVCIDDTHDGCIVIVKYVGTIII